MPVLYKNKKGISRIRLSRFEASVAESFTISGNNGEGVIEQIDGVIELDNQVYLVEMKSLNSAVSNRDIHQHLGRMFSRPRPNGIFISAS